MNLALTGCKNIQYAHSNQNKFFMHKFGKPTHMDDDTMSTNGGNNYIKHVVNLYTRFFLGNPAGIFLFTRTLQEYCIASFFIINIFVFLK